MGLFEQLYAWTSGFPDYLFGRTPASAPQARPKWSRDARDFFARKADEYTEAVYVTSCTYHGLKELLKDTDIAVCADYSRGNLNAAVVRGLGSALERFADGSDIVIEVQSIPVLTCA
jgi:hypothetical protein